MNFSCRFFLALWAITLPSAHASKELRPTLGQVYELNDLNFDDIVNSTDPWVVDIYAPWCPACVELLPILNQLASELATVGIYVGKVDGTKQRALLQRFSIRHFPSIFHLYGAETREYTGRRTLGDLKEFSLGKWRNVEPRSGCSSPVSRCGRLLGELSKIPARAKAKYFELKDTKKYSDVSLFAGMLAVPVVFGLVVIFVLDMYYSRRPLDYRGGEQHAHQH